jgi:hypothetical protein
VKCKQTILNPVSRRISLGIPVFSTNKTDHHDITEILLKVVLKHQYTKPILNKHIFIEGSMKITTMTENKMILNF